MPLNTFESYDVFQNAKKKQEELLQILSADLFR